jgi:hypothetical protein
MGQEHGQHRADDHPDHVDQAEFLPAVVDDEHTHQDDRGVDDPSTRNGRLSLKCPIHAT